MNKNIKNTTAKRYARETGKGTVIIRMVDFYPDYKGDQEFCEVTKEFYNEFFADKKADEKKETETVTVDFHTLFPCVKKIPKGKEKIELSRDLYEQIMEYRKTSDEVIIRAEEFYPDTEYVGSEYLVVKKDFYKYLVEDNRRRKREEYFDYTWRTAYNIEEMTPTQMADLKTESAEEVCLENIKSERLYAAIKQIDPILSARIYKLFFMGMNRIEIAADEGVTKSAVSQSINSALEQLKKILESNEEKEENDEKNCDDAQNEHTEFVELYEILKHF